MYSGTPLLLQFAQTDLEKAITDLSLTSVAAASVALIVLVGLALFLNKRWPSFKVLLFSLIVIVVISTTSIISGSTVYLNLKSATGGPVHWHADIELWACGNELDIRDPRGLLSNKIGTPALHEHNDKRIHLEGVPVAVPYDTSLGKFMRVIGGEINSQSLVVPLNDDHYFADQPDQTDGDGPGALRPGFLQHNIVTGKDGKYATFINGQTCGSEAATIQAFVYRINQGTKTYSQIKLNNPESYAISGHSEVPPGDCIIVEFAPASSRTNKLCRQLGIRDTVRCEAFGVTATERKICELQEVIQ